MIHGKLLLTKNEKKKQNHTQKNNDNNIEAPRSRYENSKRSVAGNAIAISEASNERHTLAVGPNLGQGG